MISQTMGTVGDPVDVDVITDRDHYKLPEPTGYRTIYGTLVLEMADGEWIVMGYASCHRFVGKINISKTRLQAVIDAEALSLAAGERWALEELVVLRGPDRDALLAELAERIHQHHPRLAHSPLPAGWCSWYCYGPTITPGLIRENLQMLKQHAPSVRYVQIDDGYQPWMGDWLTPSQHFPDGVEPLVHEIQRHGFEPAIWVAPFIASPESTLFSEHPDWFIRDDNDQPLPSDRVSFGGWRQGPWYMLDGSHPAAQHHLENVFCTMREDWGCTYFKLDANLWGALPFGRRYDRSATSVQAYRQGMAAIRRGAGDAFLLGCNQPMWPSLGEVHGSRTSMDISRDWSTIQRVARENLLRNWQNNRLWWNDPDAFVIDLPNLPPAERSFHRTATYATGGMMLSGDAMVNYSPEQWRIFHKLMANPGCAATFDDDRFEYGRIMTDDCEMAVLLNWGDDSELREVRFTGDRRVVDNRLRDD